MEDTFDYTFDFTFHPASNQNIIDMACNTRKKGLASSNCPDLPQMPKAMITTPNGFKIPALTAADPDLLQAFLQAALIDDPSVRIHYFPDFDSFENISSEEVFDDQPLSYRKVRDGQYRFRFGITQSLCLHKNMYTHRATSGRAFIIDVEDQAWATKFTNGDVAGFKLQLLTTGKFRISDGTVSTESPITIALRNNKEFDRNGTILDFSPFLSELYRIVDVVITQVGAGAAGEVTVDVKAECDGTPLEGLLVADFIALDDDGVTPIVLTAATPDANVPGRYELTTAGAFVDNATITLRAVSLLTVKAYEAVEPLVVTVA